MVRCIYNFLGHVSITQSSQGFQREVGLHSTYYHIIIYHLQPPIFLKATTARSRDRSINMSKITAKGDNPQMPSEKQVVQSCKE